jgi:HD-like signal output (HDOD) protein
MIKRLLFVDDEPLILEAFERLLRSMRPAWEMTFAEGGEPALAALRQKAYDVIVTDMRMPGMSGVELVEVVRRESPQTVRIVLSGYMEQHLAIKCVGVAHQYLSKPCSAETLRKTITRVAELGYAVQNEHLLRFMAQLKGLPSLPAIYMQLMALLNDPNTSPAELGDCISRDPAMTAQVLKIVNSAFFGLSQKVVKPADAVAYLGTETLRSIFTAAAVLEEFSRSARSGLSDGQMGHGRKVAAAARSVAQSEGLPRALVDECFVAGLLHDIGKLILAGHYPENRPAGTTLPHGLEEERALFGATHVEVGAYLLGLWGLPSAAVEAARFHHAPAEAGTEGLTPAAVVHFADALIPRTPEEGVEPSAPLDLDYLARLGLAERLPAWKEAIEQSVPSPEFSSAP